MSIEWWPQAQLSDIPPAIVIRSKRGKTVIEFGRTRFLPFLCRQVFETRFLSVWVDVGGES